MAAVARKGSAALVVAVAYADAARTGTLAPELIPALRSRFRVQRVFCSILTRKTGMACWGGSLLTPLPLGGEARREGLLTALAGALTLENVDAVSAAGPDVVGVRGAACEGGRQGRVTSRSGASAAAAA